MEIGGNWIHPEGSLTPPESGKLEVLCVLSWVEGFPLGAAGSLKGLGRESQAGVPSCELAFEVTQQTSGSSSLGEASHRPAGNRGQ